MKRDDYLSWDEYFMGIALLSAQRSKDSNTQVGACIVNQEHKIVSVGYNGMPTGCNDDDMPWEREGDFLNTKYPFVCHKSIPAYVFTYWCHLPSVSSYRTGNDAAVLRCTQLNPIEKVRSQIE